MKIKRLLIVQLCLILFTATGCASVRKDYLELAGINTVMGILIVFGVLILISFVIAGFRIISILENKSKNRQGSTGQANRPVMQPVSQTDQRKDTLHTQDKEELPEFELVAIIAAAIAASENRSPDDFIVRSIRRR